MKIRPMLVVAMQTAMASVDTENEDAAVEHVLDLLEAFDMTVDEAFEMYEAVVGE